MDESVGLTHMGKKKELALDFKEKERKGTKKKKKKGCDPRPKADFTLYFTFFRNLPPPEAGVMAGTNAYQSLWAST